MGQSQDATSIVKVLELWTVHGDAFMEWKDNPPPPPPPQPEPVSQPVQPVQKEHPEQPEAEPAERCASPRLDDMAPRFVISHLVITPLVKMDCAWIEGSSALSLQC